MAERVTKYPKPGLYWFRYDARGPFVLCVVERPPEHKDDENYACWAFTPDVPPEHASWCNYWADDLEAEFVPL